MGNVRIGTLRGRWVCFYNNIFCVYDTLGHPSLTYQSMTRAFGKIFRARSKAHDHAMVLKQLKRGEQVDKLIPFLDSLMKNATPSQCENLLVPSNVFVTSDTIWVNYFRFRLHDKWSDLVIRFAASLWMWDRCKGCWDCFVMTQIRSQNHVSFAMLPSPSTLHGHHVAIPSITILCRWQSHDGHHIFSTSPSLDGRVDC